MLACIRRGRSPTRVPPRRSRPQATYPPAAFLQIRPNGEVTVTINRLEFGQGVQTRRCRCCWRRARRGLVAGRHEAGTGSTDPIYLDPHARHSPDRRLGFDPERPSAVSRTRRARRGPCWWSRGTRWKVAPATLRTQAGVPCWARVAASGDVRRTGRARPPCVTGAGEGACSSNRPRTSGLSAVAHHASTLAPRARLDWSSARLRPTGPADGGGGASADVRRQG